jgi:hypothetical protein
MGTAMSGSKREGYCKKEKTRGNRATDQTGTRDERDASDQRERHGTGTGTRKNIMTPYLIE